MLARGLDLHRHPSRPHVALGSSRHYEHPNYQHYRFHEHKALAAAAAARAVSRAESGKQARGGLRLRSSESRGILRSVAELPKHSALGIELRASSAVAAPVSATDGSFEEPLLRVHHSLVPDAQDANQRTVAASLLQALQAPSFLRARLISRD